MAHAAGQPRATNPAAPAIEPADCANATAPKATERMMARRMAGNLELFFWRLVVEEMRGTTGKSASHGHR